MYTNTISGTSGLAYYLPENFKSLTEFYVTIGTTQYPTELIQDIELWRRINLNTTGSTSAYPQLVFVKNDRFEVWPIPTSSDTNTGTLRYQSIQKELTTADYVTGTITTLANEGTAVTGSNSIWTTGMVGRYFKVNSDGQWYKISAFTSTTAITLEREYQGVAISAGSETHTIGQMAKLPIDCYELPVYFAVWRWALFRKDTQLAREYERMWKEGVKDAISNWSNRSSSNILHDKKTIRRRGVINQNYYPSGLS